MKKIIFIFLCLAMTLACSLGTFPLSSVDTPTPVFTPTDTLTPLPTSTPVPPTATFTSTPTLIGYKSPTPTPKDTNTPEISSVTPLSQITPDTLTPTVQMDGFVFVTVSQPEFYKAKICEPSTVRITAQAGDFVAVSHVLLFVRFKSLKAERASKWTQIPMETIGAGTYLHDLSSDEMIEDAYFQTAWVEYQIIATTDRGKEIGRTAIFKENLKMLECVPTPTATSPNVKP